MSYETTMARIAAGAAGDAWKRHLRRCPRCVIAFRSKKPDRACADGQVLWKERTETAAELKEQRRLDKLPTPGQMPLFDLPADDD